MRSFENPWTEPRVQRLRVLWELGKSGTEIAAALNQETRCRFTRCAIIGKAYRLKLPPRRPPQPHNIRRKISEGRIRQIAAEAQVLHERDIRLGRNAPS